jgi:hypothetical protein
MIETEITYLAFDGEGTLYKGAIKTSAVPLHQVEFLNTVYRDRPEDGHMLINNNEKPVLPLKITICS